MASTRRELLEHLGSIDEPSSGDVGIGLAQSLVEYRAVGVIEPVAGIEREQLDFRTIGQFRGLVHNEPTFSHTGLDRHGRKRSIGTAAQQALAAAGHAAGRFCRKRDIRDGAPAAEAPTVSRCEVLVDK